MNGYITTAEIVSKLKDESFYYNTITTLLKNFDIDYLKSNYEKYFDKKMNLGLKIDIEFYDIIITLHNQRFIISLLNDFITQQKNELDLGFFTENMKASIYKTFNIRFKFGNFALYDQVISNHNEILSILNKNKNSEILLNNSDLNYRSYTNNIVYVDPLLSCTFNRLADKITSIKIPDLNYNINLAKEETMPGSDEETIPIIKCNFNYIKVEHEIIQLSKLEK